MTNPTPRRSAHPQRGGVTFLASLLLVCLIVVGAGRANGRRNAARLAVTAGMGPNPSLPEPVVSWLPTINVVTAKGWTKGQMPVPGSGLRVEVFAQGLEHPRWLHVLPNGDVLVAETNAPTRPQEGKGLRGLLFNVFMKKAGGAVPSANRIRLLRDADGDGAAETSSIFVGGLNSPFGMALVDDLFYVANTDALVSFPYEHGATTIQGPASRVAELPAGPRNHHWTKSLVASPDGAKLYVGVGSNSNAAENGIEEEAGRASIWEVDRATGAHRTFASGLRNPVGMDFEASTSTLWTAVNERDELGSDLVPDYMTSVREGAFYGWPYSYFGAHVDPRVKPPRPELVAKAVVPDYALGPHTASLGLAFARVGALPEHFSSGVFIGQHGSWNREPRSGYAVVFVPFVDGRPVGPPESVLSGFVQEDGSAMGRPVGVALDRRGALLVADDVGNVIWRVSAR